MGSLNGGTFCKKKPDAEQDAVLGIFPHFSRVWTEAIAHQDF